MASMTSGSSAIPARSRACCSDHCAIRCCSSRDSRSTALTKDGSNSLSCAISGAIWAIRSSSSSPPRDSRRRARRSCRRSVNDLGRAAGSPVTRRRGPGFLVCPAAVCGVRVRNAGGATPGRKTSPSTLPSINVAKPTPPETLFSMSQTWSGWTLTVLPARRSTARTGNGERRARASTKKATTPSLS